MSTRARAALAAGPVIAVSAALVVTRDTAFLPMHVALVTMAAVLSLLPLVVRTTGLVHELADGPAAAITRTVGWLLVGAMATSIIISFRHSSTTERVSTGIPLLTVLMAAHVLGVHAVTAHPGATGRRVLAVGAAFGLGAAALWLVAVALWPPVPGNAVLATLLVFAGVAGAGYWSRRAGALGASLTAGTIGSLSIVVSVGALMNVVPDRWVPRIVTVAITPDDVVRESRIETVDPYIALLLFGALFGAALAITFVPGLARRLEGLFAVPAAPAPSVTVHRSVRP